MADPASWLIIGTSIAGTVAGVSKFQETRAANAQAEGQAYTAKLNADVANQNAALEARRLQRDTAESRRKFNLAQGNTRAQYGILGGFGGSSLDVLADMEGQALFEQSSIVDERSNAQKNYLNQAAGYRAAASNLLSSRQSPFLNAGMTMASYGIKTVSGGMSAGMSGISGP